MAYVDVRLYTEVGQTASIQPNETGDGLVLLTKENDDLHETSRLHLSIDEARTLSTLLLEMINKVDDDTISKRK
jgi:hypothetical protein